MIDCANYDARIYSRRLRPEWLSFQSKPLSKNPDGLYLKSQPSSGCELISRKPNCSVMYRREGDGIPQNESGKFTMTNWMVSVALPDDVALVPEYVVVGNALILLSIAVGFLVVAREAWLWSRWRSVPISAVLFALACVPAAFVGEDLIARPTSTSAIGRFQV
jgi:hypothetical protein